MKIKEFKLELKKLAALIRESKKRYKDCQRTVSADFTQYTKVWEAHYKWRNENGYPNSQQYRHMHIAYCLLRGRKYEQVENKVKLGNEPNWQNIEYWMAQYREVEEIQCAEVVNV